MKVLDFFNNNIGVTLGVAIIISAAIVTLIIMAFKNGSNLNISKEGISITNNNSCAKKKKAKRNIPALELMIPITSYQAQSYQKEYEQINIIKQDSLIEQLDYVDQKFSSVKLDAETLLIKGTNTNEEIITEMRFERIFDDFRKIIIEAIKKNHLAEKTELQLKENISMRTKSHINYISEKWDEFPTSKQLNKKNVLDDYEKIIEKLTTDSIIYAREISIKREKKLTEIKEMFTKEREEYITSFLKNYGYEINESEVKRIVKSF